MPGTVPEALCREITWGYMIGADLVHLARVCRRARDGSFAEYHDPCRMVMMPLKLCTLCDRYDESVTSVMCGWHTGWQGCGECQTRMLYSNAMWLCKQRCLGMHCVELDVSGARPVRFYRQSQSRAQRATMLANFHSWIFADPRAGGGGGLTASCSWFDRDGQEVGRPVRLHNLVAHNRALFGHRAPRVRGHVASPCRERWSRLLRREYHRAGEFEVLLLCLRAVSLRVPAELLRFLHRWWVSRMP